ncbi:IS6 family transposase [Candidatus Bathyarchaeota archaeon]|nr:IS6 family transposase [Candidatus Bathyarchaeota archaeon]
MNCKYCGSEKVVKDGKVKGKQVFKCKDCKKRFYMNGKFAKMRTGKNLIVTALNLYYDGLSLRKTQRNLEQIFGETVSQVTILNWIKKYSKVVKEFVMTLTPQLSGLWHEDETVLKCEGRNIWFWEMIDEDTRFLVASHISGTRTLEDTIAIFKKGYEQSKVRPRAVFVDGSHVYHRAFNKVFWTMRKATRPELVRRVGIRTRETNNIVERLHGTLKDRTKPMRGLKAFESTKSILEGYTIHYNYVRPHQSLNGKTPAQAARMQAPNNWKNLIEQATKHEAELLAKVTKRTEAKEGEAIKVIA